MRLNAFALPALAAMFISLNNMAVQMPWLAGLLPSQNQQVAAAAPVIPTTHENVDVKLAPHQTLAALLTAHDIDPDDAQNVTDALTDEYNLRRLQVGQTFTLQLRHDADGTTLEKLAFSPDPKQRLVVSQDDDEDYVAELEARQTELRTVAMHGRIEGSLAGSAKRAGVPRSVVNQMTHWLAYDVDFARDLHPGDEFSVLYTAEYDDHGNMIHANAPQYISLDTAKSKVRLFQFGKRMFHADGQNVVRALLKTPVDGARVTSGFGMRIHPVLGYSAMHKGIDFGAPTGTPVLAAGDGVIEHASWFSSYGNYVLLKHNATYETAYGHLSRFARGIHPGSHVHQGQVIAYVGATGRATGPHLHFEVHRGGIQVNPTKVASLGSDKLEGLELKKFLALSKQSQATYASAIARKTIRIAQNGPAPVR